MPGCPTLAPGQSAPDLRFLQTASQAQTNGSHRGGGCSGALSATCTLCAAPVLSTALPASLSYPARSGENRCPCASGAVRSEASRLRGLPGSWAPRARAWTDRSNSCHPQFNCWKESSPARLLVANQCPCDVYIQECAVLYRVPRNAFPRAIKSRFIGLPQLVWSRSARRSPEEEEHNEDIERQYTSVLPLSAVLPLGLRKRQALRVVSGLQGAQCRFCPSSSYCCWRFFCPSAGKFQPATGTSRSKSTRAKDATHRNQDQAGFRVSGARSARSVL